MSKLSSFLLLVVLMSSFFILTTDNTSAGISPMIAGCCQTEVFCFNTDNPSSLCNEPGREFFAGQACDRLGVECVPAGPGCCEFGDACNPETDAVRCGEDGGEFFSDGFCSPSTFTCQSPRDIPSLSQWGLIGMAGILGVIGVVMAIRRKPTA